ncbi:hypothetical protein EDC19_1955 [Natranaerovirga hydrolytica]|uniref:PPC domain-containing protein n=1 Tax=Natranaerovirga hydrolytica TaxID=680378 RepID=A0A4R1ML52_9FIRM|nr:PPC domain-containing DNA-binding protein [Natranaerovirga hydrolytica]TCK92800.1 hypothetical protein EDC19_1955 [Natranaerovirga hydrolytica]
MDYKRVENSLIIRVDRGEEVIETLKTICEKEKVALGMVTGIGAANDITVGLFNTEEKKYYSKDFKGDFEITNLAGNISTMKGETYIHLHINITDDKMNTYGGHLNKAVISGTGEIIVSILNGQVDRAFSEDIGLNLYKF